MNTPVHDDFEAELRALLQSATATLEPRLDLDDVESMALRGLGAPNRTWARAGAIGLTAAAAVSAIVWIGDEPHDTLVPSTSTPSIDDTTPSSSAMPSVPASDVTTAAVAEPLPDVAFEPINVLVVGLDRRVDCIPPDSPYADGFVADDIGSRADSIMVVRLDPIAGTANVLSFPRDLWVTIGGRPGKGRINSAVVENDPTRLLATLVDEFGVEVDHFVQLDYCGVRTLVDGIGGVDVPFQTPVRDRNTGLAIDEPGCVRLDGLTALAYLRSRKLEVLGSDGVWQTDPTSDLGRVTRQQDFLLRVIEEWRQAGLADLDAVRSLLSTAQEDLVVDSGLTLGRMLDIAGFLAELDPAAVRSFTIEADGANVGGNSVLIPRIDSENMQATLALFRGETMHVTGDDPAVVPEPTPTGVVPPAITC